VKKLLTVFILVCFAFAANAQDSYKAKLGEYFQISGAYETFKVAIKSITKSVKNLKPEIPDEFLAELETEVSSSSLIDLVDLMVPIYKQHFTEAELDDIIKFYKSTVGQKLAAKTPVITQEAMDVGRQWGMKIGQKIVTRLQEKGYKID
jgi:uncharacterized protein